MKRELELDLREEIGKRNRREDEILRRQRELVDGAALEERDLSRREALEFDELDTERAKIAAELRELQERQGSALEPRQIRADPAEPEVRAGLGEWLAGEFRALAEGSGGGTYIVPDQYVSRVWDRLAAESVGLRSGFSVIDTNRDTLHIPRVSADASAAWTAEGATITPSDPTLAEVVATPRKLAALTQMSNEIIDDSNPSVLDVVSSNLLRALALKLDLGFFEGSGTPPEIRGLKNVASIGTVSMGTNGAAPTNLDPIADAIGTLAQANAEPTAIVCHPRTWASLIKLKEAPTGNNKPLLQEVGGEGQAVARSLYGVPVYLTSQISITETQGSATNASSIYVYQADQIIAVRRTEAAWALDRSRLFNSDQSELRAISRWDLVVPNPAAVVRVVGVLP